METMKEFERVRKLLDDYRIEPKRAFGQNFLIDSDTIGTIVGSFDIPSYDTVIEIGPGLGALTIPLADRAAKMIAVEADRDMASVLQDILKGRTNVRLINQPFEHYEPNEDFGRLLIIGNLPYNLTSKLIGCASKMKASELGFMVQKEVGDKLQYKPGDKENSALSCYLGLLGEVKEICYVPRGCFYPIPKVDSCFVSLKIKRQVPYDVFKGLKVLFSTPNKKLGNVLRENVKDPEKLSRLVSDHEDILAMRARQLEPERLEKLALETATALFND